MVGRLKVVKRKYADRSNWARILDRDFKSYYYNDKYFKGWVSSLHIKKVREPLFKQMGEQTVCIVNDGYTWLQFNPDNKQYAITTMFNSDLEIVQWYIDIIKSSGLSEEGMPYFDDMFLDVVVLPYGNTFILDQDELDEALSEGCITKEDFDKANSELKKVLNSEIINPAFLREISNRYILLLT